MALPWAYAHVGTLQCSALWQVHARTRVLGVRRILGVRRTLEMPIVVSTPPVVAMGVTGGLYQGISMGFRAPFVRTSIWVRCTVMQCSAVGTCCVACLQVQ